MSEQAAWLVIRSLAPDARFRAFVEALPNDMVKIASARLFEVECFEPGTQPAHTLILEFASRDAARSAWHAFDTALLTQPAPPLVLLAGKVPASGFDDPAIPTQANAASVTDTDPVLMLIEGSATDQDRMDVYRGIILPQMFERSAYYSVFELGGDVEVLSGDWDEAIFAISRWPSRSAARDFWHSDRYQDDAIPLRIDIGRFEVSIIDASSG